MRVLTHGSSEGFTVPRVMDRSLVWTAVDVQANEAREWVMERLLQPFE